MPSNVSNTRKPNPTTLSSNSGHITSKPKPLGISSHKSSTRSLSPKKPGLKPKKVGMIRSVINSVINSIVNIVIATKNAIRDVFYCIIPFKSIFLRETQISDDERMFIDFQKKLFRADSFGPLLAIKEADEFLTDFNVYEMLGELQLEKEKNESIVSFFVKSDIPPTNLEKIKVGKKIAKKNPPLELIAILKQYYSDQISKLEIALKKEPK